MAPPAPRRLTVIDSARISPHVQRVTLGEGEIHSFPQDQESANIKLILSQADGDKPLLRTYTVRQQRPDQFDIDITLHEPLGPGAHWAQQVRPGDQVLIRGPGSKKLMDQQADWYLLVGDMTALPSIAINLARLPVDARGYALIEVISEDDIQLLQHPAGVQLRWLVNPQPGQGSPLLEATLELDWLPGVAAVWAACEFVTMRELRRYFKQQRSVAREQLYISSYWKQGNSEEQHRVVKRADAEAGQ